jgi:GT2 family glycosyltransferase
LTPEAELTTSPTEPQAKRVSVVIVSFNRAESLRESLSALGDAHQVLVVDNGSTDGTAALEEEFPSARFIRLPKNFGLTKALNIGVRAAEGTYTLFLHDDARISGDDVSKLADFLEVRQEAGAACPLLTNATGERIAQIRPLPTPSAPDPELLPASGTGEITTQCATGAAIMFRSFLLRALSQIDEHYGNYGGDLEMCAQVRRSNRKVVVLEHVPAVHKQLASPMKKGALAGDHAVGTAVFLSKHYGFLTGMLYRLRTGLGGLFTFRFGVVAGVLGGVKIDGTG